MAQGDTPDPYVGDWWTSNAPAAAAMPTGPVTSDTDPRLTDPQHANDPEVLTYINTGYGVNTVNGPAPGTAPTSTPQVSGGVATMAAQPTTMAPQSSSPYGSFASPPEPFHSNTNAPTFTPLSPYTPPTWQGGPAPTATPLSQYAPPTQAELEASPGYLARLAAGLLARNRSAAAQGTVLNGGTQKALARYGQDYASNEYGNLVNQGQATTNINNAATQTGNQNAYETYQENYGQFQNAANMGFQAHQQNALENQQGYTNHYGAFLDQNSTALNDYLTNVGTIRNWDNDYWSHLNDLYGPGANLAGSSYKPGTM